MKNNSNSKKTSEKPWNKSVKKNNKNNKKDKKKMNKYLKAVLFVLLGIILLVVIAAGAVGIYAYVMMNRTPDQNAGLGDLDPATGEANIGELFDTSKEKGESDGDVGRKDGMYNFLVIGRDKVALNTDVIICVSFDITNSKAATVQIPRDSYVEDEDGNGSKINAVFARGYTQARNEITNLKRSASGKSDEEIAELCKNSKIGITPEILKSYIDGKKTLDGLATDFGIKKLQRVISRTFGIYFDYYAIVSTDAFVKIVDAVGGVDLYVQQDMNYDDPLQNLHIHIKKGQQHLDGKAAEGFVRFRSGYVQADIARLDAQKIFMTAFFNKLLSFSSVTKVNDIVSAVYDSVDTDISLENALGFVKPALGVDLSNITMLNMQGTSYRNGMYYSLNKQENLKIVNQYFNIFSHDLTEAAVNVKELVEQNAPADSSGMTMEDIGDNQLNLGFIRGGSSSSSNSGNSANSNSGTQQNVTDSGAKTEPDPNESLVSQPADENGGAEIVINDTESEGGENSSGGAGEISDGESGTEIAGNGSVPVFAETSDVEEQPAEAA